MSRDPLLQKDVLKMVLVVTVPGRGSTYYIYIYLLSILSMFCIVSIISRLRIVRRLCMGSIFCICLRSMMIDGILYDLWYGL